MTDLPIRLIDASGNVIEGSALDGLVQNWGSIVDQSVQITDNHWMIIAAILVFFMQAGFSLLEAGCAKLSNIVAVLLKNFADILVVGVIFLFTYAIAFGDSAGGFMGTTGWFINDKNFAFWFFQFTFAGTSATIVSGCVLERMAWFSYIMFSACMGLFIYPFGAHWIWSSGGWLSVANSEIGKALSPGAIDFAGSGVVHIVGGISGAIGTWYIGPRASAVDPDTGKIKRPAGHSAILQSLGTFILFFGWYGFNCGSTLALSNGAHDLASRVSVTTTLGASSGAIGASFFMQIYTQGIRLQLLPLLNGLLSGLVSVTAPCAVVSPWEAILIGFLGGILYQISDILIEKWGLDDPVSAVSVHWVSGCWGVLSAGLFAGDHDAGLTGLFHGNSKQLGVQILQVVVLSSWSAIMSYLAFKMIDRAGFLQVEHSNHGLDREMGVSAYPMLTNLMSVLHKLTELDGMLENPKNPKLWAFHHFLELEYAAENLDFILACRSYKEFARKTYADMKLCADEPTIMRDLASRVFLRFEGLYKLYICDSAEKMINLPGHLKRSFETFRDNSQIPPLGLFDAAEEETFSMLRGGAFKRFLDEIRSRQTELESELVHDQSPRPDGNIRASLGFGGKSFDEVMLVTAEAENVVGNVEGLMFLTFKVSSDGAVIWMTTSQMKAEIRKRKNKLRMPSSQGTASPGLSYLP